MNGLSISEWIKCCITNQIQRSLVVFTLLIAITGIQEVYAQFAGGSGTEEDPWQIETSVHLRNIADHLDDHFILSNDIELSFEWEPIGKFAFDQFDTDMDWLGSSSGSTGEE